MKTKFQEAKVMSSPSREQMEQALADQFGFPDYATLCRELERTMGKGVIRQLEKKLAQYPAQGDQAETTGGYLPANPRETYPQLAADAPAPAVQSGGTEAGGAQTGGAQTGGAPGTRPASPSPWGTHVPQPQRPKS